MSNFRKLFEQVRPDDSDPELSPEEKLELAIDLEITVLMDGLGRDYWYDEKITYGGSDVMAWLKEYRNDFYLTVLKDPEELDGADETIEALMALDLMKRWRDVPEEDLQTPEDIERWKGAMGAYDD